MEATVQAKGNTVSYLKWGDQKFPFWRNDF